MTRNRAFELLETLLKQKKIFSTGGSNCMLKWSLVVMAAVGPAVAQVNWVAPTHPEAASAIASSGSGNKVCRVMQGGIAYVGTTEGSRCDYASGNPTIGFTFDSSSSYELAVGLSEWVSATGPTPATVIAGNAGAASVSVCRVNGKSGFLRRDETVCRYIATGALQRATSYELLQTFDLGSELRLFDRNGSCFTINGPSVVRSYCASFKAPLQAARIEFVAAGIYRIRLFNNLQCLQQNSPSATSVIYGDCASSLARVRLIDESGDGKYRIQFESSGLYVDSSIGPIDFGFLVPRALSSSDSQKFEIRTIADAARRIKVISYNIMLLGNTNFPGMRQVDRAKWIVQQILIEDPNYDVITIQEAFDEGNIGAFFLNSGFDALVDAMKDAGYIYRTQRPFAAQPENGGLVIFSRWPIEVRDNNVFDLFKCRDFDCLSAKGINYAKINKLGRRYHLFTTHLNSGFGNYDIRRRQLEEFRPWILGLVGNQVTEPVIVTGDMNIDMESQPADYREMLQLINAQFVNPPRPVGVPTGPVSIRYTVDPNINDITRNRGGTREWLDYILVANPGPLPESASYEVKQYRRSEDYRIDTLANIFRTRDLSDHGAILGTFVFPFGALASPEVRMVPVTFTAQANQDGSGNPTNAYVKVNGERYLMPVTLDLERGREHQIEGIAPVAGATDRWRFTKWSDAPGASWILVGPNNPTIHKAYFDREFQVVVRANPQAAGSISGSGWYVKDTQVNYSATANPNFQFVNFTGDVDAPNRISTRNPGRVEVNGPKEIVANFSSTQLTTRFEARFSGSGAPVPAAVVTIDGISYVMPVSLPLDPARSYQIGILDPQASAGARAQFVTWTHPVSRNWLLDKPINEATYIAQFRQQYFLATAANPVDGGSVSGGNWYDAGSLATIRATPSAGFRFVNFSGDLSSDLPSTPLPINGPLNVVARFAALAPALTAQPGQRSGLGDTRNVEIVLSNTGQGPALNARITNVIAQVVEGTGSVTLTTPLPLAYGQIATAGLASQALSLTWPQTARRVRLTIQFQADGGYSGSGLVTLFRN